MEAPQSCLQQIGGDIFSVGVPSSQVTLAHVKLTKANQHSYKHSNVSHRIGFLLKSFGNGHFPFQKVFSADSEVASAWLYSFVVPLTVSCSSVVLPRC